ncbi:hypothetical protein [Gudongella oleilytica]|nr:hypothetical protein [Gudongella oleilytica]
MIWLPWQSKLYAEPDGQKPDTKACMEDKLTSNSEVQKAIVTHAGRSGR